MAVDIIAEELMVKAFNKKKGTWLTKLFNNQSSILDASAEIFSSAAIKFRSTQHYREAASAFIEAAICHKNMGRNGYHQAATLYIEASKMVLKHNVNDNMNAIQQLEHAINIFLDDGNFKNVSKYKKEIGELYEKDNNNKEAINAYLTSIEWSDDNSFPTKLRVAHLHAQLKNFSEAAKLFEEIAIGYIDTSTMRWSVPRYLFKSCLCILANGDIIGAQNIITKYKHALDASTHDYQFLTQIMEAIDSNDTKAFTNSVIEYDTIKKLDPLTISVLLSIKRGITEPSLT